MRRVMVLEVTGGTQMFPMEPWVDVMEIYGETEEFIGAMRAVALCDIIAFLADDYLLNTSDLQLEALRSMKIRLHTTGLAEYPEDPETRRLLIEGVRVH